MKAHEFVVESAKTASAEQVWNYVDGIHPDDQKGDGFLKSLIVRNPQYELKRVPLSSIHIPDQEYDDEEQQNVNMNLRSMAIIGGMHCIAGEGPSQRQRQTPSQRPRGKARSCRYKGKGRGNARSNASQNAKG